MKMVKLRTTGNDNAGSLFLVNVDNLATVEVLWNDSDLALEPGVQIHLKFASGIERKLDLDMEQGQAAIDILTSKAPSAFQYLGLQ